jgi:FixJ family two-component response regulator
VHRLLLVEDDTGEVALLRSMLAEEAETAFTLDRVPGMLAAITVVTNQPSRFDALLVNVRLSDGGGLELIADLQRRGIDIPVLLVSTFHDAELERQALRLGAADYLTRHEMVPLALRRAIRNAVERHALTRELRDSERRYRTLAGSFPRGCVLLFDHRGQLLLADGEASSQLGLVGPAAIGRQITELLPDMAADLTSAAFDRLRNRPLFEGRHGDRWYLVSLRRLELDGMPSQLLVVPLWSTTA